jgi:subtilisin family serine protease
MKRVALAAAALTLAAACQDAAGPRTVSPGPQPGQPSLAAAPVGAVIPGQYIVVLRASVADVPGVAREIAERHGGALRFTYTSALKGFALNVPDDAAPLIATDPRVAYVEQDKVVRAIADQANPTWGIDRIDERDLPLDNNYHYNVTGAGVTVYIIDTGIRFTHTEFGGRAVSGTDKVDNDNDASDCNGHGTHVAGTVGGTVYGVAKAVTLVGVRVLDCGGNGTDAGVIAGVDWVTANRVLPAVANMSLGGGASQALDDAVTNSINAGVTYAIAAGNGYGNACDGSPARVALALTVGATNINDVEADFSDRGSCLDIWAPGVNITSAWSTSDTALDTISGTSMASPHVAGAAALYLEAHPNASAGDVDQALSDNATTGKITWTPTPPILQQFGINKPDPPPPGQDYLLYTAFIGAAPPPPPPAAPTGLTATAVSSSQIDLAWTDNSGNEDGFKIERCQDAGTPCTDFAQIATVTANTTIYQDGGVAGGATYRYRVRAHNSGGNSAYSNEADATTPTPPPPPAAPSDLTATEAGTSQIDLAWIDNSGDEDGFKIERCQGASCTNFAQITTVGANVTTFNDTGLNSGTTYRYRVRAHNANGNSSYSNVAAATTASPPNQPPVARYTWNCNGKHGRTCTFNGSNSTDDNGISSYSWTFGDGSSGSGVQVTKTFTTKGSYNVTLQVTDNGAPGLTNSRTCAVQTGTSGSCQP